MADQDPRSSALHDTDPAPPGVYGGKPLDSEPPADHQDFLEVRALGLSAIRARLAARRKKR